MKERIKFDLDFLKSLFFFVLTALCAVVGYAVTNMENLTRLKVYAGIGIVVVLVVTLAFTIIGLIKIRKLMEDVK